MSCKIIGFENGPLEVDCTDVVFMKEGKKLEAENPSHPCRCGHSKNKPWCDGSHVKAGFTSKREIDEEMLQVYEGKEITIHFNRSICAGAAACVHGLPTVFKSDSPSDWIRPDNETNAKIVETIKACPSGALSYSVNGKIAIDGRSVPKITIIKNGPYRVEGVVLEEKPIPTNFSTTKYTLCRCGYSKNRPYCDYSHAESSWSDEG
ncbi:MAG: CDGSH iron-sulfur domain-containing protein [Campylobacterota bacterium]